MEIVVEICNLPDGSSEFWRVDENQLDLLNRLAKIGALAPDVVVEKLDIILMN